MHTPFEIFEFYGQGECSEAPVYMLREEIKRELEKLKHRHQRALDRLEAAVKGLVAAGELYSLLAPVDDYVHFRRVVMGETLGYLEYLVSRQKLIKQCEEDVALFLSI